MKIVSFGEIAKLIRGVTFSSEDMRISPFPGYVACLRTTNIQSKIDWHDLIYIPENCIHDKDKWLKTGDILISTANSKELVGKVARVGGEPILSTFGGFTSVIRPNQLEVSSRYLFYYLSAPLTQANLRLLSNQTTNIANLGVSAIQSILVPLPPLSEQYRIASILAKADHLRCLRRYALELSGMYLQTVFLEMFGDPVMNPKGWKLQLLGDLLSLPPHLGTITPAKETGKQLCVRVGEVGGWNINLSQCKYTDLNSQERKRFSLFPGDIVLARAIGSEAHLGKLSIMGRSSIPVVFDSHLMRLRPDSSHLLPFFLAYWLKTDGGRARFMRQARRTAVQFNINAEQLSSIEIPVPPLPLQQNFAEIITKYERLRSQQREALRQAEHLFQTLLHRAFQGELISDQEDIPSTLTDHTKHYADSHLVISDGIDTNAYQPALPLE